MRVRKELTLEHRIVPVDVKVTPWEGTVDLWKATGILGHFFRDLQNTGITIPRWDEGQDTLRNGLSQEGPR